MIQEEENMPTTKKSANKTVDRNKLATGITKKVKKGDKYLCDVCGLVVSVDTVCGCVDMCDILCCGKAMKHKQKTTRKK
jgi:hypothetical protein